ncbi:hypothetical protein L798_03400 [Zootermopsis nevadensis]|uniref:Uncharacterized protein n=1 Tax=Zootermopsis nevadensis TaxID=136037 RepID=A0A067QQQ6_ZOONE|nr:hypothetical protein L798_03400 [Zootermopsis nevadensis]
MRLQGCTDISGCDERYVTLAAMPGFSNESFVRSHFFLLP